MADLIDRQAAIDVASGYCHPANIADELRKLPSAQPDLDEWCTDCSEYDSERHCCPRFNRVIRDAVEEAKEERKTGHWILHPEQRNVYGGICIECSECGEKYVVQHILDEKYCRNCGADMRGEQDDESRSNSNAQTDTRARGMGATDKSSGI